MSITTQRATKKAYITDINGGNVIDFQFTPETLELFEGGRFADRISLGEYHTDYIWISGKPNKLDLKMWVDRTMESTGIGSIIDPFSDTARFPKVTNPRFTNFDIVNLVRSIKAGSTSSGFQSTFFKRTGGKTPNTVDPSVYAFNPEFPQDDVTNNTKGVYQDVERLMYYVRPQGFKLSSGKIEQDGSIKLTDFSQTRFTPPPKARFFYGNLWCEGYIEEVKYTLSVMNRELVPKRLEADISFIRTRWGYLEEVTDTQSNITNFNEAI